MFYTFSLGPELSIALGALIVLLAFQSFLIIRRIRVKKPPKKTPDAARAAQVLSSLKKASKQPAAEKPKPEKLDSGAFARFESNLERQGSQRQTAEREEENDVIVSLSSKSKTPPDKRPPAASQPKTPPEKETVPASKADYKKHIESLRELNKTIKVDPIDGLFDDVQETTETPPVVVPDSGKTVPEDTNKPLTANEFLTDEDFAPDPDNEKGSAELVISMAKREFEEGKYEDSLATIRQFLQDQTTEVPPGGQLVQILELKGENECALSQYDRAAKTLQEIISKHITKNSPEFLPQLESYIKKFKASGQERHAVHFMFTALNEYRQLHDHQKMDEMYGDIEIAYRQNQDWPRLIQTYQNHLTIKKALKDYQGQLDLLDQLGKLLYDQGEEDKSRKCYKQRLVVEKEMERAAK